MPDETFQLHVLTRSIQKLLSHATQCIQIPNISAGSSGTRWSELRRAAWCHRQMEKDFSTTCGIKLSHSNWISFDYFKFRNYWSNQTLILIWLFPTFSKTLFELLSHHPVIFRKIKHLVKLTQSKNYVSSNVICCFKTWCHRLHTGTDRLLTSQCHGFTPQVPFLRMFQMTHLISKLSSNHFNGRYNNR
jgi:hypothetical protein